MENTKKWFSDCYRRNLVDMHIEDWNDEFLSKFSPEAYVANLKKAHIQTPMLYLQSHVGHCYFPTKVGHMHRALTGREGLMKRLVDLCHAEGMHVVGYYSLIYNTVEEDRHPEWRLVAGADRLSARQRGGRYGHCCPNNPEYRAFVLAQIREMAEYFTLDGMFYDMTFWPNICCCDSCMKRYKEETGRDSFPAVNWTDPDWLAFQALRVKWLGEFAKLVTDETKRLIPGCSVEHNYANAVASPSCLCGSSEIVNESCDFAGGDLYGDLYNHSFTAKYYYNVTKNQPFEYMTCRCDRSLGAHTNSKSEEALAVEVMLTTANHGASFIIDAIDPVGTLDSRVYDRIGKVFERQMPYEKYFSGDLIQDVGVYYSTLGRFNSRGQKFDNKTCSVNLTRTLIEENVPVGVTSNAGTGKLSSYRFVFAPQIAGISDENRADLVNYVKNGGLLYVSGAEDEKLLDELLGAKLVRYTEENAVYLAPTAAGQPYFGEFNPDYPIPTDASLPVIEVKDAETLAVMKLPYTKPTERRFASIHSNPPGILTDLPGVITKKLGKGRVVWSAAPIENDPRRSHRKLIMALMNAYLDRNSLSVLSDAPRQVELVSFRRPDDLLISAVDLLCTDELLPIRDFTVSMAVDRMPSRVIRLGGRDTSDRDLAFRYENGRVRFDVNGLVMFDMFRIVF